jgi:hypothetical protein
VTGRSVAFAGGAGRCSLGVDCSAAPDLHRDLTELGTLWARCHQA